MSRRCISTWQQAIAAMWSSRTKMPEQTQSWLLSGQEIPLTVKVLYTLFVCVLVPVYWNHYGPANFLWFSDLALLITLAAQWLESPLLASMQAVSVVLLELMWIGEFLARLLFGVQLAGIAGYMFKTDI